MLDTHFVDIALKFGGKILVAGWYAVEDNSISRASSLSHDFVLNSEILLIPRNDIKLLFQERDGRIVECFSFITVLPHDKLKFSFNLGGHKIDVTADEKLLPGRFDAIDTYMAIFSEIKFSDQIYNDYLDLIHFLVRTNDEPASNGIDISDETIIFIDHANVIGLDTYLIRGWIASCHDPSLADLIVKDRDGFYIDSKDLFLTSIRPDVSAYLKTIGRKYEYCVGFYYLVKKNEPVRIGLRHVDNISIVDLPNKSKVDPFNIASELLASDNYKVSNKIISLILDTAATTNQSSRYTVNIKNKNVFDEVAISFIIPLFGRWDFVKYHRLMFSRAFNILPKFEVIYVVDDPGIEFHVMKFFNDYSPSQYNIKVVSYGRNIGFAGAINEGVACSDGTILVLMNSDIYIEDFQILLIGASAAQDSSTGLVGFTLLYEDESIQHDGIIWSKDHEYRGMMMPQHIRKGLPLEIDKPNLKDCRLLTGAFLCVEKSKYISLGGFPTDYIYGDFEDIDLSMKFDEIFKNKIVRAGGVYHLERQSFTFAQDANTRQAILIRNATKFFSKYPLKKPGNL